MTRRELTNPARADAPQPWLTPACWGWLVVLGLLFIACHAVIIRRTLLFALHDSNWSHALLVPLIAGWFLYQQRHRLHAATPRPCGWGLPILLAGLAGYTLGIYPVRNDMIQGYSMIVSLFGLVLFVLGPSVMRVLWFPIVYLAFAVKVSDRLWEQVAFELQQIAAVGATFMLQLAMPVVEGLYVEQRGAIIELTHGYETHALNVAEACSGLRMLMAFVALGAAVAFLQPRPAWQRVVMIGMAAPIAVAVNIGRVTVLGLLALRDASHAQGETHALVGMLMLIPAGLLFLLLGWVMRRLVIHEPAEARATPPAAPTTPPARVPSDHGRLRWPTAALATGMLLAFLTGQGAVLAMTEAVLFKEAVPLRHRLMQVPTRLGAWAEYRADPPLSREMLDVLGTEAYLSRWYRDADWPADRAGGVVRLHVAYYTGAPDTVPHVPDRCFVAAGAYPRGRGTTMLNLPGDRFTPDADHAGYRHPTTLAPHTVRLPDRRIPTSYFTFAAPHWPDRNEHVFYFFIANGRFHATPEAVRLASFDPRERYSYYCKVEIQVAEVDDRALATERAAAFAAHAVPELLACLPDWVDVREGRWPPGDRIPIAPRTPHASPGMSDGE